MLPAILTPTRTFLLCWALALAIFLPWLPSTVQYGDSGELVGNALTLTLSHPPGFPLYHWLYHLALKIPLPFTPYYQGALFTALLLSATLALIAHGLKPLPALALTAFLALQPTILRQALLPDVFALHALLTVAAIQIALSPLPTNKRFFYFAITLALAGANHPAAIFLAPLLLTFRNHKPSLRTQAISLSLAAALFTALYASLLLLNHESALAWPAEPGLKGLLHHILRSNYGSFQLSAQSAASSPLQTLWHFLTHAALMLAALAAILIPAKTMAPLKSAKPILLLLALYLLLFYPLANIRPSGFGAFVLERFHLYPLLLLAILLARALAQLPPQRSQLSALLLIPAAAWISIPQNQWQRDTVLEDLVANLHTLAASSTAPCSALFLSGDSPWAAYTYLAATRALPNRPTPISKGILVIEANQRKLTTLGLRVNPVATESGAVFDLAQDLILPNLSRCEFFTLDPLAHPGFQSTVLPLGRKISSGTGLHLSTEGAEALQLRSSPSGSGDSLSRQFFAHYAQLPLLLGMEAAKKEDWAQAKHWFERAAEFAPGSKEIWERLCETKRKLGDEDLRCLTPPNKTLSP